MRRIVLRSSRRESLRSIGSSEARQRVRGILRHSTNMTGMKYCSTRTRCTRISRPASCAQPCFGGIRDPNSLLVLLCLSFNWFFVEAATYIWRRCGSLKIRLDRPVLLVEEGHIRNQIFDDVCVRKRIDARFFAGFSRYAACGRSVLDSCER